jgi:hypothetical protein
MKQSKAEDTAKAEKTPMERSAKLCLLCFALGVINVAVYWVAVFSDKAPDATVACTGMVEMIAPVLGYFIYQAKLKDSRNKYGIAADGTPYAQQAHAEADDNGAAG